jgi:SAM-dependent methyltransferase
MKREWNDRARENALGYIDTSSASEEAFRRRAVADAECILADVGPSLTSDAAVVEIGCGVGRLLEQMASRFREVWGVDVSGEMVKQAHERLGHLPHVRVSENSGADLAALPSDHFDLCYSFIVFQHVPERAVVESYIRDAYRVLRSGGLLKIQVGGIFPTNPFRSYYAQRTTDTWEGVRFTMSEIVGLVESAAFRVLSAYHADERQLYLWVVARKAAGDEWETVYFEAGRALAGLAAPGETVAVPEHGLAVYLGAAGVPDPRFVFLDPPGDSAEATAMLERARRDGARYLLLTKYAFWWLEHYRAFAAHLRSRHRLASETANHVLFDLGPARGEPGDRGRDV